MSETNEVNPASETSCVERLVMLPPLRPDLRDFEKQAGISVDVLVKVKSFSNIVIGRYLYGLSNWQVNGVCGYHTPEEVEEWWPMPELGTGTKAT
jgi:hypothetical protein